MFFKFLLYEFYMFRLVLSFRLNSYPYSTLVCVVLWLPHICQEISRETSMRNVLNQTIYSDRA